MSFHLPEQVAARQGLADTPGARLWYWDTGGCGEVVVMSHPLSQGSGIWGHQQPAFAQAGYRVVAYARRGFDRSEHGAAETPGTAVGDFCHFLDALAIEAAHVIGAAAGGGVAMRLAAAHPERVTSLVLAGSIVAPAEADWLELYARLDIKAVKPHVSTAFIELGPSYRAGNPEGTARFAALSAEAHRNNPVDQPLGVELTWGAMERTPVPVLLLAGEADLYAPPPLQRLLARHLPRHEIATIREAGHAPYWEAPEAFNALVLDFLKRHRAQA
jgi:pimeloyl-ACP methyl ester carboxylesterase